MLLTGWSSERLLVKYLPTTLNVVKSGIQTAGEKLQRSVGGESNGVVCVRGKFHPRRFPRIAPNTFTIASLVQVVIVHVFHCVKGVLSVMTINYVDHHVVKLFSRD